MTCTHSVCSANARFSRAVPRREGFVALLARWADRRRQRRALAELDDRLLRDVGIAPRLAVDEAPKPFWR